MNMLAWPMVVLILGIVFLFLFRNSIAIFLTRFKKVSPMCVEASSEQIQL